MTTPAEQPKCPTFMDGLLDSFMAEHRVTCDKKPCPTVGQVEKVRTMVQTALIGDLANALREVTAERDRLLGYHEVTKDGRRACEWATFIVENPLTEALATQSEEMSMLIDIVIGGYDRSERAEDRLHKARARLAAQSAALEAAEAWLTSYGYDLHDQLNRHPLADVFDATRASMRKAGE